MEAVAAFALACNILQVVEFSTKVVSKGLEYRQSLTGRLKDHIALESTIDGLEKLIEKLERDAQDRGGPTPSEQIAALQRQLKDCSEVAKEIRTALDKVKVNGAGRFKSYRKAFRAVWSEADLESLKKRLSEVQQQIQFLLTVEQRDEIRSLCSSQADLVRSLDQAGQRILENLLEGRDALLSKQSLLAQQQSDLHREGMNEMSSGFGRMEELMKRLAMEAKEPSHNPTVNKETIEDESYEEFLDTLRYRSIDARYEAIDDAYVETLEWVLAESFNVKHLKNEAEKFTDEITEQLGLDYFAYELLAHSYRKELDGVQPTDTDNLCQWLRSGQGYFWIWGKPGCGKSTLMKFLISQPRYIDLLQEWSSPLPVVVASFFIWKAGGSLQKSQLGLWQSLLVQILDQRLDLVPALFGPGQRLSCIARRKDILDDQSIWSLDELVHAFKKLQLRQDVRICLHIDGLDEFEGQPRDLLDLFDNFTTNGNIKTLCAGRWERVFEKTFSKYPSLAMHQLTWTDLARYTTGICLADSDLRRVMSNEPTGFNDLLLAIVKKAEGVFLWVKVVVQSLIYGSEHRETTHELLERLQELPSNLHELYQNILDNTDARYLSDVAFWLLVTKCFHDVKDQTITSAQMLFASNYDPEDQNFLADLSKKGLTEIELVSAQLADRVRSRCPQFLSTTAEPYDERINFVHRSVLDFLQLTDTYEKLNSLLKNRPNPYLAASAGLLGDLVVNRSETTNAFLSDCAISDYEQILQAEIMSNIRFDPLRDQVRRYLMSLERTLSPETDDSAVSCMVYGDNHWTYSTKEDLYQKGGLLKPLFPFLAAYDTNYAIKCIKSLPRVPTDEELFWALCSSIFPPLDLFKLNGPSTRSEHFQYHLKTLVLECFDGDLLPLSRRLWRLYLDFLQQCLLQHQRYAYGIARIITEQFLSTLSVFVAEICLHGADLNILVPSRPGDCDRTSKSPLAILKAFTIDMPAWTAVKLATEFLEEKNAKEITRRPRRWSWPLSEQVKAFQGIAHTRLHDASPFQSRLDFKESKTARQCLRPKERQEIIVQPGGVLHTIRSSSCLKRTSGLEAQYICGSGFRPWADLQHVLIEMNYFDRTGYPYAEKETSVVQEEEPRVEIYSRPPGGIDYFGLSDKEYHFARYGRSAPLGPWTIMVKKLLGAIKNSKQIGELFIYCWSRGLSFGDGYHLGDHLSYSQKLILSTLNEIQQVLRESVNLMEGLKDKPAEVVEEAIKVLNTALRSASFRSLQFRQEWNHETISEGFKGEDLVKIVSLMQVANQKLLEIIDRT